MRVSSSSFARAARGAQIVARQLTENKKNGKLNLNLHENSSTLRGRSSSSSSRCSLTPAPRPRGLINSSSRSSRIINRSSSSSSSKGTRRRRRQPWRRPRPPTHSRRDGSAAGSLPWSSDFSSAPRMMAAPTPLQSSPWRRSWLWPARSGATGPSQKMPRAFGLALPGIRWPTPYGARCANWQ